MDYLEKAFEICPSRHVAWHHLGLAYRSWWIVEMDFPEAWTYKPKDSPQSHRNISTQDIQNKSNKAGHISKRSNPTTTAKQLKSNKDILLKLRTQYVPPQHVHYDKERMQPHNHISFYHILDNSNPSDPDPSHPHPLLQKAAECLKKATTVVENKHNTYLKDLARVCVSMGKYDDAISYMAQAKQLDMTDAQKVKLYEMFATIKHLQLKGKADTSMDGHSLDTSNDDGKMEDITSLYLRSLEYANLSKTKSRIAYYNIVEQLNKQLDHTEGAGKKAKLHRLIAYVKSLVDNRSEAILELQKGLELNPKDVDSLWLMSKLSYSEEKWQNAWQFLERALAYKRDNCILEETKKVQVIKTIAKMTTVNGAADTKSKMDIWQTVLPFLHKQEIMEDLASSVNDITLNEENITKDLLLVGISTNESNIQDLVYPTLTKVGLRVFLCTIDGHCDIPSGEEPFNYIQMFMKQPLPALIYCDIPDEYLDLELQLARLAAEVVKACPVCCCLVAGGKTLSLSMAELHTLDIRQHMEYPDMLVENAMKKLFIKDK